MAYVPAPACIGGGDLLQRWIWLYDQHLASLIMVAVAFRRIMSGRVLSSVIAARFRTLGI